MSRKFINNVVNHVYQRTRSGFNIFYEVEDYLVYYTIFSVLSVRYSISVYGLCLMIDHLHSLISASSRSEFSSFMSNVTIQFVKEYNRHHLRSGPLFGKAFGWSPKSGLKLLRTAIAYLFNNPVERLLCGRAQDFRWNFLAYASSKNPFSEPLVLKKASRTLRRALREVDGTFARKSPMTYVQLGRLFAGLDNKEKNQLIDYIIVKYNVLQYDKLTAECYNGYDNMVLAINSNAGSEYDIPECKFGYSDVEYRELYKYVHKKGFKDAGEVISLPAESKFTLMLEMLAETAASKIQICKYLHLQVAPK